VLIAITLAPFTSLAPFALNRLGKTFITLNVLLNMSYDIVIKKKVENRLQKLPFWVQKNSRF
jgi:hypothetical protein